MMITLFSKLRLILKITNIYLVAHLMFTFYEYDNNRMTHCLKPNKITIKQTGTNKIKFGGELMVALMVAHKKVRFGCPEHSEPRVQALLLGGEKISLVPQDQQLCIVHAILLGR